MQSEPEGRRRILAAALLELYRSTEAMLDGRRKTFGGVISLGQPPTCIEAGGFFQSASLRFIARTHGLDERRAELGTQSDHLVRTARTIGAVRPRGPGS
jgi:hypothetical protein